MKTKNFVLPILISAAAFVWAACSNQTKQGNNAAQADSLSNDTTAVANAGTTNVADDLWTEDAVKAQVRKMYDRLNEMNKADEIDLSKMDEEFCTGYYRGLSQRIAQYDKEHAQGDMFFWGDEGYHWIPNAAIPITILSVKAELLTGDMARAQVKLKPAEEDGSEEENGGAMTLELWMENGRWCVNNFLEPEAYGSNGYLGLMEDYARTHDIPLEDED